MDSYVWDILSYVGVPVVVLILNIIYFVINKKKGKLTNITLGDIFKQTVELISTAETFKNYTGVEKKTYVLTRIKQLSQNIYNDEQLSELIDKLVDFTNTVNVPEEESKDDTLEKKI